MRVLLTAVAACAILALAGVAHAQTYTAYLTPAQEVPAVYVVAGWHIF